MRIMTFNIQHGLDYKNQRIDLKLFSDFIKENGADVCGLNEVRGKGEDCEYTDQTDAIGDALGFFRYFGEAIKVDEVNPYGNAIVSRYPFKSAETVHIPNPDDGKYHETRCVIKAVFEIDGRDVCVLVCHMGLTEDELKNAVDTLCHMLDEIEMPVILMGDFNASPHNEMLCPLLERLSDSDEIALDEENYTFASYDPYTKIDYIFYRGLKCSKAEILKEVVSDHFPIIAEFEFSD